jgi:hypothetical protein
MKKVTRLLILTAMAVPIFTLSRAYAGAPHLGQPGYLLEHRQNPSLDRIGEHDPLRLEDPIGGNIRDIDRDHLGDRDWGRDHDPYSRHDHDNWDNGNGGNGGGTAPLDGGISLLLAAGIGLGLKKARERKKASEQRNIENAE